MTSIVRIEGTVREFFSHKGFGFITGTDGMNRFFLRRDMRPIDGKRPDPQLGARVSFIVAPVEKKDEKGRKLRDQAIDIEVM